MPYDSRRYMHRQYDALVGVLDGFHAGTAHFLAARTAEGTIALGTASLGPNTHHAIAQVHVSLFGTPSGTSLLTLDAQGTTLYRAYLSAGNNAFRFEPPLLGPANTAIQVVVNPGGGTAITHVHAGTVVPFPYIAP